MGELAEVRVFDRILVLLSVLASTSAWFLVPPLPRQPFISSPLMQIAGADFNPVISTMAVFCGAGGRGSEGIKENIGVASGQT